MALTALTLRNLIDEADIRVPNAFPDAQKVDWLNEVNAEFFDIVKIPKVTTIVTDGAASSFTIPTDCVEKNIIKVVLGSNYYRSMIYEDITAAQNYYYIDNTGKISFTPKPPLGSAIVVYNQIQTTSFISTTLTAIPDAPSEYHWIYILGLATRIAKSMNDVNLANNYENDFKSNLAIAQQNFSRG